MTTTLEMTLFGSFLLMAVLAVWIGTVHMSRTRKWQERFTDLNEDRAHVEKLYSQMSNKAVRLERALNDRDLLLQRSKQSNDDLQAEIDALTVQRDNALKTNDTLNSERDLMNNEHGRVIEERDALAQQVIHGSKKYELTANVVDVAKSLDPTVKSKKLALELTFEANDGMPHHVRVRELVKNHTNAAELARVAAAINYKIKQLIES